MNPETGEVRQFQTEAEAKAAGFSVPLKRDPNPKCKSCYGRGHVGKNLATGMYEPCKCTGAWDAEKSRVDSIEQADQVRKMIRKSQGHSIF